MSRVTTSTTSSLMDSVSGIYTISGTGTFVTVLTVLVLINICVFSYLCIQKNLREGNGFFFEDLSFSGFVLGISMFSSTMGSWILFFPGELAYYNGWMTVVLYPAAVVLPMFCIYLFIGKARSYLRNFFNQHRTFVDFIGWRFAPVVRIIFAITSILCMAVNLAGELVFVKTSLSLVSPNTTAMYMIVAVVVLTLSYTLPTGLSSSIISDLHQAVIILLALILGVILLSAQGVFKLPENALANEATWNKDGLIAGLLMIVSFFPAYIIDQAAWQRVYRAHTTNQARIAVALAMVCCSLTVALFSVAGIFTKAYAKKAGETTDIGAVTIFYLFMGKSYMPYIIIVMMTALVSSSIDSLQAAIFRIAYNEGSRCGVSTSFLAYFFMIGLNVGAVFIALYWEKGSLILFLISNLVACCIALPVLLGFSVIATDFGVLMGMFLSLASIFFMGLYYTKSFISALKWIALPEGVSDWKSLVTFAVATVVSIACTLLFSGVHLYFSSYKYYQNRDKLSLG